MFPDEERIYRVRHRHDLTLSVVALALVAAGCLAWSCHAAADEFRAVVVTDQESAALRAAKARADEAQAAFSTLRTATEERYKSRFQQCCVFRWSDDFRVIVEERWSPQFPPSNLQWPPPSWRPYGSCGPNCVFLNGETLTSPATLNIFANDAVPSYDTGVLWKLDIPGTLSTGPVKSPLVFK